MWLLVRRNNTTGELVYSDRIEALGSTLQVTSPAGTGTTLLVEIPLEGAPPTPRLK